MLSFGKVLLPVAIEQLTQSDARHTIRVHESLMG